MKIVKKTIDINAHINNLTCQVIADGEKTVANIGFDNLGFGTITAIKFLAKGYNSFGDNISVNGKTVFFLIIQDIRIEKNTTVKNLKVHIPNPDIRKLELSEAQICYSDDRVLNYEGKDIREFELLEYELYKDSENTLVNAVKEKLGTNIKYKPADYLEGGIVDSEKVNKNNTSNCTYCNQAKEDVFKYTSQEEEPKLIESYLNTKALKAEASKQEAEQKEKDKKKRDIFLGISACVAIVIIFFIIHATILAGRLTFLTEADMRDAIEGTYTHYDAYDHADQQIKIDGNILTRSYKYGSDYEYDIEWDYKNGIICSSDTFIDEYIVLKNGDIKDTKGSVFEKGSYMSKDLYDDSTYSNYENAMFVLEFQNIHVTSNSSFTICSGSLKNTGTKTYKFVEVKGAFKDSSGNVIDTGSTYAVGSEGLAPNESTTFDIYVDKNSRITSCTVSLFDYD